MQFTNTSGVTSQTDTTQHNAGGELHARLRNDEQHTSTPGPAGVEGAGGTGGPDRRAGGRRQGLAGLRDDAPSAARGADGERAGRRPPAHTAARPNKTSHAAAGPGRASRRHAEPIISTPCSTCVENTGGPAAVPMGGGRAWQGIEPTRRAQLAARTASGRAAAHRHTQQPGPTKLATRRQGLAGLRDDTPSQSSAHPAPLVWRAPEGPEGTGGLRGAAPNKVRSPSLAGGRALRRPEHPWGHKQHEAARPHRGPGGSHVRPL